MSLKKLLAVFFTAVPLTFSAVFFAACNGGESSGSGSDSSSDTNQSEQTEETTSHEHTWTQSSVTQATCGEAARTNYTCTCGNTKSEKGEAATGSHTYNSDGVCTECGYIDMSSMTQEAAIAQYGYYIDDTDDSDTYNTGDSVYFGSYPQTLVADETLISTLSAQAGTLPTATAAGDWTSYGYYANGSISDYMFYKDVTVEGVQYRGVYLLGYRPYYSALDTSGGYSYIDDQGYELSTVYWFEYTPIKWTVLDFENGKLLLNCKYCVEGQPFQDTYEGDKLTISHVGSDTLLNDWESSYIRSFLNGTFYNLAFSSDEQALIQSATLDNKYSSYSMDNKFQTSQNDTTDNVFLLSYQDVLNTNYGFNSEAVEDSTRSHSFTSYALIQGLRPSGEGVTADGDPACYYMLRSAGNVRYSICGVSKLGTPAWNGTMNVGGTSSYDCLAYNGDFGVLPALYLKVA